MNRETVYIVVELSQKSEPKIIDVFRNKKDAEECLSEDKTKWRNIIEKEVK